MIYIEASQTLHSIPILVVFMQYINLNHIPNGNKNNTIMIIIMNDIDLELE